MAHFDGFSEADFGDLEGSSWRNRESLGGMLARNLTERSKYAYRSWGVRRRLELHLAQERHYRSDDPRENAKLFVYTHTDLMFGFYVESPDRNDSEVARFRHFRQFRDRLIASPVLQEHLFGAMNEYGLVLGNYYRETKPSEPGSPAFRLREGRWERHESRESPWRDVSQDDLLSYIQGLPGAEWMDLHVFGTIARPQAIAHGPHVADELLRPLTALLRVYEMVVA